MAKGPLAWRLTALFLALASPTRAQESRYHLFQEEVDLSILLRACARALDLPIDYDPEEVDGLISIDAPDGLTFAGLWAATNRRLSEQGLACIQLPGEEALSVVRLEDASGLARIEFDDLSQARAGFVKVIYSVHHAVPRSTEATLRELLPAGGSVASSLSESGHILLAGLKPQVVQAQNTLLLLDGGPEPTLIEEIEPRHLTPTALAAQLTQLREKRTAVGAEKLRGEVIASSSRGTVLLVAPASEMPLWLGWLHRFDRPDAILTRDYSPSRFGLNETASLFEEMVTREGTKPAGWRVVTDELTGTLVVSAPVGVQEELLALFERLEGSEAASRRALRSFPVTHRDVEELIELLDGLMEGGEGVPDPRGGLVAEGEGPAPGPQAIRGAEDGRLTISADKDTNRILAYGEVHLLSQLEALVATLDVAHPPRSWSRSWW